MYNILRNIIEFFQAYFLKKEHPVLYSTTGEIQICEGIRVYQFPKVNILDDCILVGLVIRPQNEKGTRASKNAHLLVDNDLLAASHITLRTEGFSFVDQMPLEHFVHDWAHGNEPGTYVQMFLNKGFDPGNSELEINDPSGTAYTLVDANHKKVIEITYIYIKKMQVGCSADQTLQL